MWRILIVRGGGVLQLESIEGRAEIGLEYWTMLKGI